MPAEDISFRVACEGPLTEFTKRNPTAVISLWCDWKREVIGVGGASVEEAERLKGVLAPMSSFLAAPAAPSSCSRRSASTCSLS